MGITPMMQQYLLIKDQYKDCILMYRLGDFYEMFFDDALTASRELEITLTGRDCGLEERAPMCGVPYHSVEGYISKLIKKGYKVAICEQVGDPAASKGLVEREVTRVITPGTLIETTMLDESRNNYIVSLCLNQDTIGLAFCDVSTGEFFYGEISAHESVLMEELSRIQPSEIICDESFYDHADAYPKLFSQKKTMLSTFSDWAYDSKNAKKMIKKQFGMQALSLKGLQDEPCGECAAGALLSYLEQTQKVALGHINRLQSFSRRNYMMLDHATRRNLELTQSISRESGARQGTLLYLLNRTRTSMGARKLRLLIEQPLQDQTMIEHRLDAVEELYQDRVLLDDIREMVNGIYDIARLCSRISYNSFHARDCLSLKDTASKLPGIKNRLSDCKSSMLLDIAAMDALDDIYWLLEAAISPDAPISVMDGGIIRNGYDEEVDKLRNASANGKEWLNRLEAKEREETGIKNLKIGYNKVFGYYIEITKSNLAQVPYRYTRKQTLVNAERFVTQELKDMEETILSAHEQCIRVEHELFMNIREKLRDGMIRLQAVAAQIALLDCLQSLAYVALHNDYCRPKLNTEGIISIQDGRHPVVEQSERSFISNHTDLDMDENQFLIITGPNMAGKSTYMRQVALITLMAHIGSFVPAGSADISLTDCIFTRVGASDDLFGGQSTFMVEMGEMAAILHQATPNSLLIIDEVGRGTSTFDGLSIAWAVIEYICGGGGASAKTLFATHFHELSELEGHLPGVKNYRISVKEVGETIVFLRKIVRGSADKSFGIQVARLAGMPQAVIDRAKAILSKLEKTDINQKAIMKHEDPTRQLLLFEANNEVLDELKSLDVDSMTPLQAMNTLQLLKNKARGEV
ncbi:MAG: DNA mismatch repair protein MutS [Christensenellales bacterium]|jgi:DNA mismatch repair protein MutS